MRRILLVARRDFIATVSTKGFIVGLLVLPALISLVAALAPRIPEIRRPVSGEVAIVDPTGRVSAHARAALAPDAIRARRLAEARRVTAPVAGAVGPVADQAIERAVGQAPSFTVVQDGPGDAIDDIRAWLLEAGSASPRLAVVVVHRDALLRRADGELGSYDLYTSRALDEAGERALHESMHEALVSARLESADLDRGAIEATLRVVRPEAVLVTAAGARSSSRGLAQLLPFAMGLVLFIGVVVGGQSLMTSMVEEKSSRVVEVLLAAVSPFELMAGKLIGQLGVGLLVLALYVGLGLTALYSFAVLGLIEPMLLVYLVIFFLITYMVFGALMLAIGAAVNQPNEAQSLMVPVLMLLVIPYMLSPMIGQAPNSTFAVVLSFVPPVNTIAMMARLGSESPPPAWQVWATALLGLGAGIVATWFAAKIFRVGLLMHGRPPDLRTLIRWARQA